MQFEIDIDTMVNGAPVRRRVKARQHLGCEHGVCGACSVLVNGKVVRGCLMLAVQADGKRIDTIEGLSDSGAIADLQTAFAERNAAQCGFCTPGMLLTAHEMLAYPLSFPPPQAGEGREGARCRQDMRQHIREFISGNFCRCTGYEPIVDAIESVLRRRPKR
jgi:aerobic-type carbon monoxide dehydrogenase small subunit (CoxS/CutS family)